MVASIHNRSSGRATDRLVIQGRSGLIRSVKWKDGIETGSKCPRKIFGAIGHVPDLLHSNQNNNFMLL